MAGEDVDRADIDRLVKELDAPIRPPAPRAALAQSATDTTPASPANGGLTPGSLWSTAKIVMPPARKERRDAFAFLSAIRIPGLPALAVPALPKIALPAMDDPKWVTLSARIFVGLGVAFSAAMRFWPYANAWSWGLLAYLAAVMLLLVTGIWGAKLSWDARMPAAHTLAIGTVVWGLGLLAAEAVPRIGYVYV